MLLNPLYKFQCIIIKSTTIINKPKRKSKRLNKRKETLFKKAYKIREFYDVNVVLILYIYKTSHYITFKSVDLKSFPLLIEQIISLN
jgi:hypothetical protein